MISIFILGRPGDEHTDIKNKMNGLEHQTRRTLIGVYAIKGTVYGVFRDNQG